MIYPRTSSNSTELVIPDFTSNLAHQSGLDTSPLQSECFANIFSQSSAYLSIFLRMYFWEQCILTKFNILIFLSRFVLFVPYLAEKKKFQFGLSQTERFSAINFIVLALTCRFVNYLKLIFVYGIRVKVLLLQS